jgi:hypothetical protein
MGKAASAVRTMAGNKVIASRVILIWNLKISSYEGGNLGINPIRPALSYVDLL